MEKKCKLMSIIISTFAMSFAICTSAQAHFPWINMEDGTISANRNLKWTIGWGHRFPLSGMMNKSSVGEMKIFGPNGTSQIDAEAFSDLQFQSSKPIEKPGGYIIAMTRQAGFHTKTTEGYKSGTKKEYDNVITCTHSNSFMKAVANVETADGDVSAEIGHEMEIIPQANPEQLRVGDMMPIKVMYKGKPFKTTFFATYAGFSNDNNVFAYTASTDSAGHGKVKILSSGPWLVTVSLKEPYADQDVCDTESYRAALTFEIP